MVGICYGCASVGGMVTSQGGAEESSRLAKVVPIAAPTPLELAHRLAHPAIRLPLAIALTDAEGYIRWTNSAFTRQTGYPADEVLGRNRLDLYRGPVVPSGEVARVREAVAAGRPITTEFQTWTRDGQLYWISCVVAPTVEDGRVGSFLFAEEDITQRRRSEDAARSAVERAEALAEALRAERELLANVLATIPHVVFWTDAEQRYLGCNTAYLSLRGVSSATELIGRREDELPAGNELAAAVRELETLAATTGAAVVDRSVVLTAADGERRTMLLSVLPRHAGDETQEGVIGVGADVTRVSELERQLAQATRLESIGQLAAGLAHEINTPIQYVSDNMEFLVASVGEVLATMRHIGQLVGAADQDLAGAALAEERTRVRALVDGLDLDFLSEEIPSALEQTIEGVGRVADIVRAMKEFSHPGHGRADTDLNRAVETTVQISRNEWKYIAELALDLDPDLGTVPCYEGELKQVILNLIVNAAHAVAEGQQARGDASPGRIGVATRREEHEVTISVSDDGCGMDAATQHRIFDPFFTTKQVGKGTGQGLSMAHGCIVGKHGGSIDVRSTVGQGSTFTIRLPLVAT